MKIVFSPVTREEKKASPGKENGRVYRVELGGEKGEALGEVPLGTKCLRGRGYQGGFLP